MLLVDVVFFFKQKTAYEMRISDWSSDVCSSDLGGIMRAVHDKIEGPFAIEENIALYGMVAGDATLHRGIRFILHGTITGNLTIETGARAIIHGTVAGRRSEEHTSELQSLMRISYAVFCLKKKKTNQSISYLTC